MFHLASNTYSWINFPSKIPNVEQLFCRTACWVLLNYQLNSSIYVATGCHCYVALIKTDIHLTAFDRLVYREIQLIAFTLMTYSKARAPELRLETLSKKRRSRGLGGQQEDFHLNGIEVDSI